MKPTQRGEATQEHQALETTCKCSSGLLPALQGQAGIPSAPGIHKVLFHKAFLKHLTPLQESHKKLKSFSKSHGVKQALAGESVQAASAAMSCLGISGLDFPGRAALSQAPSFPRLPSSLTSRGTLACRAAGRRSRAARAGRDSPRPAPGLQAAGTATGSRACQGRASHRHCWTAGSNTCIKPFKVGLIPPIPQEAFINRISINPLIKYQH